MGGDARSPVGRRSKRASLDSASPRVLRGLPWVLVAVFTGGCQSSGGQGQTHDVPSTSEVQWALGWWRDPAEDATAQDGLILRNLELRDDGAATLELLHCRTSDEVVEARWVPAASDVVHLVGESDGAPVPWISGGSYSRIELSHDDQDESIEIVRIGENADGSERALPAEEFLRGRKCMTDVVVTDCATQSCDEGS